MTDLIPLDAALSLPPYDSDGEPSGMFDHKIFVKLDALRAIPAIDPAAIREAALREAAELCDRYPYVEGVKTAILAMIGEKK